MKMKNRVATPVIVLLIGFGIIGAANGYSAAAAPAPGPMEKTFDVKPGQTLDIDLKSGGSIAVTGWEKNQAVVTVHFINGGAKDWKIDFRQGSEGLDINSRYTYSHKGHYKSPSFDIKVPSRFNLKIRTMGGKVVLDRLDGNFSGKTMGGDLKLSRLKGTIDLKTMGGEIVLEDSDIDGKVKTMGGRVLLEDVVGDVKGSSMGGNVIYKNVKSRSGKSTGKIVQITTMGGAINVSDAPHGAKVSTMGGNIRIKSAGKFIQAKTMGGNIDVDEIDGCIKATTMGGDVKVTMTGDPDKGDRHVTLSSMGGDITLHVPAGLSMDIGLELSYTKRSRKNFKIISDFDIQQTRTDDWETRKGSPRKYIYGKGKTKGGKHKIRVKTINGNIILKRN